MIEMFDNNLSCSWYSEFGPCLPITEKKSSYCLR